MRMSEIKRPILTAMVVTSSAEIFPSILDLYVEPGARIADVTYGRGVFWRKVPEGMYDLTATDSMEDGVYFQSLPYEDESFDVVVFDPPYMARGGGFNKGGGTGRRYHNTKRDQHLVLKDYSEGAEEAHRVLVPGGLLILKCQDGVEHAEQHWMHCWIMAGLEESEEWKIEDLFIMMRKSAPPMRHAHQRHARKNHSFFVVARKVSGSRTVAE
jgi:hypothetical protein